MAYRFWILIAFAVFILWLSYRYYTRKNDFTYQAPSKIPIIVCLVILLIGSIMEWNWQSNDRAFTKATGYLSQGGVIRCQRFTDAFVFAGGELGHVMFSADGKPEKTAMITWDTCHDAVSWLDSDKNNPTVQQVIGVHVINHEAIHERGEKNEAKTECLALLHDAKTAENLGATKEQAERLASKYWTDVYPRMPESYKTHDCSPGGALDPNPNSDQPWPLGRETLN